MRKEKKKTAGFQRIECTAQKSEGKQKDSCNAQLSMDRSEMWLVVLVLVCEDGSNTEKHEEPAKN